MTASNRPEGGALLSISWPRESGEKIEAPHSLILVNN